MIIIKEKEFKELAGYIKSNYGINLLHKKSLIESRLGSMLEERGFSSFTEYLEHVFSDNTKGEITNLINKLTTNHTFFLREAAHFDFFRDRVLPHFVSIVKQKDLRIWSAGCSTGEEPYTLAMIMEDFFGDQKKLWDTKILATDISVKVLSAAERGIYPSGAVESLPPAWKLNYLTKLDKDTWCISNKIRNEVIFRVFNLIDDTFPFKRKFHVIFCRNVMIYFDHKTKAELINKFYEYMEPGGYLFIGHSESIDREETPYKYIMPAVYRKG